MANLIDLLLDNGFRIFLTSDHGILRPPDAVALLKARLQICAASASGFILILFCVVKSRADSRTPWNGHRLVCQKTICPCSLRAAAHLFARAKGLSATAELLWKSSSSLLFRSKGGTYERTGRPNRFQPTYPA